jgi:hypothetical protein
LAPLKADQLETLSRPITKIIQRFRGLLAPFMLCRTGTVW